MPNYEFVCMNCRKRFSKILSISSYTKDKNSRKCPKCNSRKTERTWSSVYAITSKKS